MHRGIWCGLMAMASFSSASSKLAFRLPSSRLSLLVVTSLLLQACADAIVSDGRAGATIVVPEGAPPDLNRAATELQTYVRKTSGVALRIETSGSEEPRERVEIRLAVHPLGVTAGGDPRSQIVHEDGYAIKSGGRAVTIMGGSPRGTLYGVYDFIERALGVRWFMPTELGEDIVEAKTIPVPELDIVKNPAFDAISGFIWAGGPGAADWEQRMRVRVGEQVQFGHNWYNIHPLTKANFEKDPEMFALVGGERGRSSQLCTSHPDVIRVSADAARSYFKSHPNAPLFSISPNDGTGFCECDRCRRIDALYGVTDGALADRFVHYANAVLADLETTSPGKRVGIYAYAEYTSPPKRARPLAGYETALTHMPWEFCHVHPIDDPSCAANRRFLGYLKGWAALTRHVGVYEYYGHFFAFTPWPIVHSMRRDIPLFKSLGIERFISETQQNWANQGINFYVGAKLVNDPETDVDALLDEYFTRFYGAAKGPMRLSFDLWEDAMLQTAPAGDAGYAWLSIFTLDRVKAAADLLERAEELAAQDSEKIQRRVALARSGFAYTQAYAQMLDAGLRGDAEAVARWSEEAQNRIKTTEGSAPQAFFVSLALDQTRYLEKILARGVAPWIALRPVPFATPDPTP